MIGKSDGELDMIAGILRWCFGELALIAEDKGDHAVLTVHVATELGYLANDISAIGLQSTRQKAGQVVAIILDTAKIERPGHMLHDWFPARFNSDLLASGRGPLPFNPIAECYWTTAKVQRAEDQKIVLEALSAVAAVSMLVVVRC